MTLPAGGSNESGVAGDRSGDCGGAVAALDPFVYQEMRDCWKCGGPQIFVAVFECETGRLGFCLGCGDEKAIPFSRKVA